MKSPKRISWGKGGGLELGTGTGATKADVGSTDKSDADAGVDVATDRAIGPTVLLSKGLGDERKKGLGFLTKEAIGGGNERNEVAAVGGTGVGILTFLGTLTRCEDLSSILGTAYSGGRGEAINSISNGGL